MSDPVVPEPNVVSIAMAEKMLGNGKVRYLAAYPTGRERLQNRMGGDSPSFAS